MYRAYWRGGREKLTSDVVAAARVSSTAARPRSSSSTTTVANGSEDPFERRSRRAVSVPHVNAKAIGGADTSPRSRPGSTQYGGILAVGALVEHEATDYAFVQGLARSSQPRNGHASSPTGLSVSVVADTW